MCFNYFSSFFYSVKTLDDSRAALLKELASSVQCFLSLSTVLKVFTVIVRRNNIIASLHFTHCIQYLWTSAVYFLFFFFFFFFLSCSISQIFVTKRSLDIANSVLFTMSTCTVNAM